MVDASVELATKETGNSVWAWVHWELLDLELGLQGLLAMGHCLPLACKVTPGWKRQALDWKLSWHVWSLWTESRPPPFFVCFQSKGVLETLLFYESKGVRSRLPVVTGYTLGSKTWTQQLDNKHDDN